MVLTMPAPVADAAPASVGRSDLIHVVCCDLNLALCGTDVTNDQWYSGPQVTCQLCAMAEDVDMGCASCSRGAR